jgi:hypothetical protein
MSNSLDRDHILDIARDRERPVDEVSDEAFDRTAFARRALDLVRPERTRIAICEGAARMRLESGRAWGRGPGQRWAILAIPRLASRRAIALAVAELAQRPSAYVLDVLFDEAAAE